MDHTAARPFDALGERYERAYGHLRERHAALDWLCARLPAGARVLDVGCGTGRPAAARLAAAGFGVTGIDVSATMVQIAARQVPGARFHHADVRDFAAEPGGYDAVVAFFPFLQMPRRDLDRVLARMISWVAPGGHLLLAAVPLDAEDRAITWLGQPVRASGLPAPAYAERLTAAGLTVLHARVSEFVPDYPGMGPERHVFCYARRPGGPPAPAHELCGPHPLPERHRGPLPYVPAGWLPFERRLDRGDVHVVANAVAGNTRVLDVGGGSGTIARAIAARTGDCVIVDPGVEAVTLKQLQLTPGRAERLPFRDGAFDAVVAAWTLHHADDLVTSVAEMARVCDAAHPAARIVVVQGAPDSQVTALINEVCAPIAGEPPSHQGFLLGRAATVLSRHGYTDVAFRRVPLNVRFPEREPSQRAGLAAETLASLWYHGHPRHRQMRKALVQRTREHFAGGATTLRADGVMMTARPPRLDP
ncbi:methyltransferase domain-containing protein [Actinomadura parmotrematis]|uniref:Methyltransferase domain-containing protein n=1 Tax=Actinomadura parmotrematis TaxID=2864039 RepID=A0ABS7FUI9_9ACTN|nr:methyltransferase domain-containing protein [Actinomadura parmotrematis]MBW8483252.1 methyltransferase domain-containing protein [Actinomadura parmotrematis]